MWEGLGVFFLIIAGSLQHFTYDWSNQIPIVGVISPVNESVWEYLKLGFWSTRYKIEVDYFCFMEG